MTGGATIIDWDEHSTTVLVRLPRGTRRVGDEFVAMALCLAFGAIGYGLHRALRP